MAGRPFGLAPRLLVAALEWGRPRIRLALASLLLAGLLVAVALLASGGCGPRARPRVPATNAPLEPPAAPISTGVAEGPPKPPPHGRGIRLTFYYLVVEDCPDPPQVLLPRCGGGSLGRASAGFKHAAAMQGSARLCDGRIIGVQKVHPLCFAEVMAGATWGMTASGRPATPFRSVAVDPRVFPLGRWYVVPELIGAPLPAPLAGRTHDGCVRADDVGGAVKGEMVDLFVGPRAAVDAVKVQLASRQFTMANDDGRCANLTW